MELYEAIEKRRTIRDFIADKPVPEDVLERILAATAEGLGVVLRIPLGTEEEEAYVLRQLGAPAGYKFPCYLAFGCPKPDAPALKQYDTPLAERLHKERW